MICPWTFGRFFPVTHWISKSVPTFNKDSGTEDVTKWLTGYWQATCPIKRGRPHTRCWATWEGMCDSRQDPSSPDKSPLSLHTYCFWECYSLWWLDNLFGVLLLFISGRGGDKGFLEFSLWILCGWSEVVVVVAGLLIGRQMKIEMEMKMLVIRVPSFYRLRMTETSQRDGAWKDEMDTVMVRVGCRQSF